MSPNKNMNRPSGSLSVSRRDLLRLGICGSAGIALDGLLSDNRAFAMQTRKASAKSVIQIWMWGGPSHLDTFDPKPEAGRDYCGPLDKPIETNISGTRICQLLPLLAKQADKYSLIRSMTHGVRAHETASYLVQTGRKPGGRLVYPSVGAIVSQFKGYPAGYKGLIPPYIVLSELQGRFSEVGFLDPRCKPFATGGDPARSPFLVEGIVAKGITRKRQRDRRSLLRKLNSMGQRMHGNEHLLQSEKAEQRAYDLILGDAGKVFDLAQEKDEVRERYGRNSFGQSCLMARRLVEEGVPYVTINYKGWDTHKQHFQTMNRKLPQLDRGLATLLSDLDGRGLLDSTIVWMGGEFGRTPKVQWEPPWSGGRGHFGAVFSSLVAGGGFKGGQVVGASDAKGEEVSERPVYPCDLIGSMVQLLGIDPDGKLPNPLGKDIRVTAGKGDGVPSGGRLKELMKGEAS